MLDKKTYKILKTVYRTDAISYKDFELLSGHTEGNTLDKYANALMSCGFIKQWREKEPFTDENGEALYDGYEITLDGRAYVEQRRKDKFLFWVPYTITTVIAILSLISTFCSN